MAYKPTAHTIFRKTDEKGIALNLQTEQYYTLNEVGVRMWELLQEKDSLAAVVAAIEAEYEVPRAKVETDLQTFLADLQADGLIEPA